MLQTRKIRQQFRGKQCEWPAVQKIWGTIGKGVIFQLEQNVGKNQDNNLSIKKKSCRFHGFLLVFCWEIRPSFKTHPFCQTFTGITLFPENISISESFFFWEKTFYLRNQPQAEQKVGMVSTHKVKLKNQKCSDCMSHMYLKPWSGFQ